uniref:Uncharacterized protein n=1 Tax=Parascaris univalens TaxID=6257 RepID=A0A915BNQ8_PARUN
MAGWMRYSKSSTSTTTSSSSVSSLSSRSTRGSRKGSRSVESDSDSPPSYAVVEDRHGNLVSKALNVIWPQRPEKGRYSLDEYKRRKAREKELQRKKQRLARKQEQRGRRKKEKIKVIKDEDNAKAKQSNIFSEGDNRNEKYELSTSKFLGVMAYSQLRRLLRPNEFRLYYACPETISSLAEVPIRMPLKLVCMSSSGKLYQFGFNEELSNNGSINWQLDLGPFNKHEQPIFKSLKALLKYYESYANIHQKNGTVEIFPIHER